MRQFNFDLLILTEKQKEIFKKFMNNNSAFLTYEEYNLMADTSLLKQAISNKSTWFDQDFSKGGLCTLSHQGEKYRTYLKNKKSINRSDFMKYFISLFISIIIGICTLIVNILCK